MEDACPHTALYFMFHSFLPLNLQKFKGFGMNKRTKKKEVK